MPDKKNQIKKTVTINTRARADSDDSGESSNKAPSLKSPRTARFAEATAVNSPIEPKKKPSFNFDLPKSNHFLAQPQPGDFGGNKHDSVEMPDTDNNDYPPQTARTIPQTPLKSAMKTPGAAPKNKEALFSPTIREEGNTKEAIFSPTFKEEELLEKEEQATEKEQAKDLKIKTRVRLAKIFLRGINFSCALIIISLLATSFMIFNATKVLPARNSLPPWAENQMLWPQITVLVIACISLAAATFVIYCYFRGGHRRAEKAAMYYSTFAVAFFLFSIVMFAIGAGVLQGSRQSNDNKDMWGWSCVDNERKQLFEKEVSYDLICRLQNWSLVCCIIEIVVELLVVAIYGVVFYRFYRKRQLRKSMAHRDRARSDFYLAQLRSQSAPNTPGVAPYSARDGGFRPEATFNAGPDLEDQYQQQQAQDENTQYISSDQKAKPQPFRLQPPPIRIPGATPKMQQVGFTPVDASMHSPPNTSTPDAYSTQQTQMHHPQPQTYNQQAPYSADITTHQPRGFTPQAGPYTPRQASYTPQPPPSARSWTRSPVPATPLSPGGRERQQEHQHALPGERVYESVPIPGAYEGGAASPSAEGPRAGYFS